MSFSGLRTQREYALACMILALGMALSVHLAVFGKGESLAVENARRAVAVHEVLLRQTTTALEQNEDALISARSALEEIRKAHRP